MKSFNFGVILGRFQGMHLGHVQMIEKGLTACENLLVMVGSSQESFTERNPFTCQSRMDVIKMTFKEEIAEGRLFIGSIDDMTNEDDHCVEWGDYVLNRIETWKKHFNINYDVDLFIYGNDEERRSWYRPEAIENISHLVISRNALPISATKMRQMLVNNKWSGWVNYMPVYESTGVRMTFDEAKQLFDDLREELLRIPHYREEVLSCQKQLIEK